MNDRWRPVTEGPYSPAFPDAGIDMVLTPREQDKARIFSLEAEKQRRKRNREDRAAEAKRLLDGFDPEAA